MQPFLKGKSLRQNEYHGIVLKDKDPKNQGRYRCHIPDLMPLIKETKGIWVKNHLHKWRYTFSKEYFYGEYKPIQEGTLVLIKFYEDDLNTGYIDRIVSDQIKKTLPKIGVETDPVSTIDRDDVYLRYKTPKKHNMHIIFEETSDSKAGLEKELIPNSVHIYFNELRTTHIINEDGIHWFTKDNRGVTVEKQNSEWIKKDEKIYVEGNRYLYVQKFFFEWYIGGLHNASMGPSNLFSVGKRSVQSSNMIAEDAPTIHMNSGKSVKASFSVRNKGEDEIIKQKKVKQKLKPEKKDKPDLTI